MNHLKNRITKLEAVLRPKARLWVVDWFTCESTEAAAACVPAEKDGPPLLVDYHQVAEAHPSAGQSVIVLLPADPPCVRQHTSHEHPERMIDPYPLAILDTLKSLDAMSDLELNMMCLSLSEERRR